MCIFHNKEFEFCCCIGLWWTFFCQFGNEMFQLLYNSFIVSFGLLFDRLYKTILHLDLTYSINTDICKMMGRIDVRSFMQWHGYLRHISNERIQRLIKRKFFIFWTFLILAAHVGMAKIQIWGLPHIFCFDGMWKWCGFLPL